MPTSHGDYVLTVYLLQNESSALLKATEKGYNDVVEVVLKLGADVNLTNSVSVLRFSAISVYNLYCSSPVWLYCFDDRV
jgi:hypothetical protein